MIFLLKILFYKKEKRNIALAFKLLYGNRILYPRGE